MKLYCSNAKHPFIEFSNCKTLYKITTKLAFPKNRFTKKRSLNYYLPFSQFCDSSLKCLISEKNVFKSVNSKLSIHKFEDSSISSKGRVDKHSNRLSSSSRKASISETNCIPTTILETWLCVLRLFTVSVTTLRFIVYFRNTVILTEFPNITLKSKERVILNGKLRKHCFIDKNIDQTKIAINNNKSIWVKQSVP